MFSWVDWKTSWIFALFVIASPFMMIISGSFLSFMLGFNVFLAYVPLAMMWLLKDLTKLDYRYKKLSIYFLFALFILFFPNTFYIITDLIHLNSSAFYTFEHQYAPIEYLENLSAYIMLTHILMAIGFGIYAGLESLRLLRRLLNTYNLTKIQIDIIVFGIIVFSSIGIYIGRFTRFFSWDIIRINVLLSELLGRINGFFLGFIALFIFIQMILDLFYRTILKQNSLDTVFNED